MFHRNKSVGLSASEERLERLISDRLKPNSDKEFIDRRIWDLFGEEWCVMFTDLSGFSRNVAKFGIIHFLQTIYESEQLLVPVIADHDGILLKTEGDSFLVIFRKVDKALHSAIDMQRLLKKHNVDKPPEEQVLLCVGLGYGQVLRLGDSEVYGAEVNAAGKLGEDTAGPWQILVTEAVKTRAHDLDGISFKEIADVPPGADKAYEVIYEIK
jgi:class 3 adenylate cyclase